MKKTIFILAVFLSSLAAVLAQESHGGKIEEGKALVESKISCDKFTDEQLEAIGDYYMEQMHPGEAHELMDKMMGGEGSESLKQVHVQTAKRLYCNADAGGMMGGGMMGLMNMMGGGMMGNYPADYGYGSYSYWTNFLMLLIAAVISLIVWLVYKYGIKKERFSETPFVILKKRFAKGEITKRQFEDMKKHLVE